MKSIVYAGTYSGSGSCGIYIFEQDISTGRLKFMGNSPELENPSFLTADVRNRHLYSVSETESFSGQSGGGVGVFSIDPDTGLLKFLNAKATKGNYPCHISLDGSGKYLFAANYGSGSVTVFKLHTDGSIGAISDLTLHRGSGPNTIRQAGPHAHFVKITPDQKYLCAVDLGIDRVVVYGFDPGSGKLASLADRSIKTSPGSGPRHLEFSTDGRYAYLINELSPKITVLKYDPEYGFRVIQDIFTLEEKYQKLNFCAAVKLSPDGRFLYASNRGHDSISVFKADRSDGLLEFISSVPSGGSYPRDISIDPTGRFLLAANQKSGVIAVLSLDRQSGIPEPTGEELKVPNPVCICFAQLG